MLAQYEEKMKKTIESLEKEYSTIRTCESTYSGSYHSTLLWSTYTIAAGGKYHSSRSKNDYDLTLGVKPDQRDREGDCMF